MTHPIYTRDRLSTFSLSQLKAIAAEIGANPADKRKKQSCIEAIATHQSSQIEAVEIVSTCESCPNYLPNEGEENRGWCKAFDRFARAYHQATDTCQQLIDSPDEFDVIELENAKVAPRTAEGIAKADNHRQTLERQYLESKPLLFAVSLYSKATDFDSIPLQNKIVEVEAIDAGLNDAIAATIDLNEWDVGARWLVEAGGEF